MDLLGDNGISFEMYSLDHLGLSDRQIRMQVVRVELADRRVVMVHVASLQYLQLNQMIENAKIITRPVKLKPFQQIVALSEKCQVCLSRTDFQQSISELPDRLVQCKLCLSSIHQKHYGSELYSSVPQQWHCQRCLYLLNNPTSPPSIKCQFCPYPKGIMKIIEYDKKKIWSHPECITWDYPIKVFTCRKMTQAKKIPKSQTPFEKFWYPDFPHPKCCHDQCSLDVGEFVKCRYYSCGNHYHVPCARSLGVIRELEGMRVQNNGEYTYVPVLCPQHLQKRGIDFRIKADKTPDKEKYKYITNLAKIYEKQYAELLKSSKQETKEPNYKIVYTSSESAEMKEVEMEVEEPVLESQSQLTPVGQQSVYSERLIDFLEAEMKNALDDMDDFNL